MQIEFRGYHKGESGTGAQQFRVFTDLTAEEAAAIPKKLKLKAGRRWAVINLKADEVNGGVNEAGIKRIKDLIKHFPVAPWGSASGFRASNEFETLQEFLNHYGIK